MGTLSKSSINRLLIEISKGKIREFGFQIIKT
jgi:hypothetical protein